jgi:hypothetical protein
VFLQSRSTPPILSFLCCMVNIFLINKNDLYPQKRTLTKLSLSQAAIENQCNSISALQLSVVAALSLRAPLARNGATEI